MNKTLFTLTMLLLTTVLPVSGQDSLAGYLETALQHNPSLLSDYEAFYASLQKSGQAGTLPDPTLGIGLFIQPVETRVGPQQARFSLSQMFPWFGTLSAKREQMDRQAEAAYWNFAGQARMLVRQVRAAYYELWVLRKLELLQEQNLTLIQSMVSLATTRFRSGDGRLAEVLRVQLDVKSLRNQIAETRDKLDSKKEQFFLLLNVGTQTLYLPDTIEAVLPVLGREDSLIDHPRVRASKARSEAAVAYGEAARKQGYPSLGVGLDYVLIGKRDDMAVADNGRNALMPMITVGLPVWRKKYRSMQEEANAMQRQYIEEARARRNELLTERERSEYMLSRALENIETLSEQIDLATRMLDLTETDFANDQADLDDFLEYQEKLLQYRQQHLLAYGELLKSLAEYDYLTGENPEIINEFNTYENEN